MSGAETAWRRVVQCRISGAETAAPKCPSPVDVRVKYPLFDHYHHRPVWKQQQHIIRIAVRVTNVSRHYGGPIEGPLKPLSASHH